MEYSHEHLEIQKTLKRFIDAEINPHVDEWEAAEIFPAHEVFKKLGNLGLLGLTKPEAYGGIRVWTIPTMAMAETLGHIDCGGIPMAIGVQTDMCTPAWPALAATNCARVPGPGHRGRHGGLHRRERAGRRQRRGRPSRAMPARMATTTSSPARRCGSPTACRPTGCACWSTPAKARSTRTRAW
jgi:alkylation response protein AidB-like acyl-CoA dehydrogenase